MNPIQRHFTQPGGVPAVTLCSGVLGVWCVLFATTDRPDHRELLLMFGVFTALPSAAHLVWRVVRPFKGAEAKAPGACALCGQRGPTSPVRYVQLTGLVILMLMRELPAHACRRCSRDAFLKMTLHTLALGWWGLFPIFVNPGFVANNLLFLLRSQLLGGAAGYARARLDERREWIKALRDTKDEATVVSVVSADLGVSADEVTAYLRSL